VDKPLMQAVLKGLPPLKFMLSQWPSVKIPKAASLHPLATEKKARPKLKRKAARKHPEQRQPPESFVFGSLRFKNGAETRDCKRQSAFQCSLQGFILDVRSFRDFSRVRLTTPWYSKA
jgi:hypothetical protein